MDNDIFYNPTKVIFGRNTELLVGDEVAKYGDKVLLHYGGGSAERSGLLDRVRKSLKASDITVYELGGVKSNPRLELVYEGIAMCRSNGIGFVLAVGGGSVIDSAKALSLIHILTGRGNIVKGMGLYLRFLFIFRRRRKITGAYERKPDFADLVR